VIKAFYKGCLSLCILIFVQQLVCDAQCCDIACKERTVQSKMGNWPKYDMALPVRSLPFVSHAAVADSWIQQGFTDR
jgi:hypothetical protein